MRDIEKILPKPLLDDLISGDLLPIIGAGFSKNAITPANKSMPLWEEMGKQLASEIKDYQFSNALDAISAYAHEFSRPKLIEKLRELLLVGISRPGKAHKAFCSVAFETVLTTNFDFLIEQQYQELSARFFVVTDELQLTTIKSSQSRVLIKFHGDLNNPKKLVVTEDDYDTYVDQNRLMATYVSNLLITKTPVFIGYSIDDFDFRQLWRIVIDRLGKYRRQAYAIVVDASANELAKFRRRGVTVITLPGNKKQYDDVLADFFESLGAYLTKEIIPASTVIEEKAAEQLLIPEKESRLVFFALPFVLHSQYKEYVFPLFYRYGLYPITSDDVVSPGENWLAKVEALIVRANYFVTDLSSSSFVLDELQFALRKIDLHKVLVISNRDEPALTRLQGVRVIHRAETLLSEDMGLLSELENWLEDVSGRDYLQNEPTRLFELKEYRAAVISANTLLETELLRLLDKADSNQVSFSMVLALAGKREYLTYADRENIRRWRALRNKIVHGRGSISRHQAERVVLELNNLIKRLRDLP